MNHELDLLYTDERAERRIYEPLGMTPDELLEWYCSQPLPFRKKNMRRIVELSQGALVRAVEDAIGIVFPAPKKVTH